MSVQLISPPIVPSCPLVFYSSDSPSKIHPKADSSSPFHHYRDGLSHYHPSFVLLQLLPLWSLCFLPQFSRVYIQNSSHSDSFKNASYITSLLCSTKPSMGFPVTEKQIQSSDVDLRNPIRFALLSSSLTLCSSCLLIQASALFPLLRPQISAWFLPRWPWV